MVVSWHYIIIFFLCVSFSLLIFFSSYQWPVNKDPECLLMQHWPMHFFYLLQTHFGISSFSHPDNALEVCGLLTPLHIVPEWYFLCQYAMLKAVPNKNAGFIILLTSIFIFLFFGEIRNLTTLCLLNNNGFSLSSFFSLSLSFLWIGLSFGYLLFKRDMRHKVQHKTSSSKFSGSFVQTLQPLPLIESVFHMAANGNSWRNLVWRKGQYNSFANK